MLMKGSVFTALKYETLYFPAEDINGFPPIPQNIISKPPSWSEGSTAKSKGFIYPSFLWILGLSARNPKDGCQLTMSGIKDLQALVFITTDLTHTEIDMLRKVETFSSGPWSEGHHKISRCSSPIRGLWKSHSDQSQQPIQLKKVNMDWKEIQPILDRVTKEKKFCPFSFCLLSTDNSPSFLTFLWHQASLPFSFLTHFLSD